ERLGDLLRGRRAAERRGELLLRGLHLAGPAAHRAAGPVQAAQLVQERAADAGGGEAAEGGAPLGVEGLRGGRERGHAGGDQVFAADVRGQAAEHLADEVTDQRQVAADEVLDRAGGRRGGGGGNSHGDPLRGGSGWTWPRPVAVRPG